jgi:hypothetical protein
MRRGAILVLIISALYRSNALCAELPEIQQALDAYYAALNTYEMEYREEWLPLSEAVVRANREAAEKDRERTLAVITDPEQRQRIVALNAKNAERGTPVTTNIHRVYSSYPSLRIHTRTERKYANGDVIHEEYERAWHGGNHYWVDLLNKEATTTATQERKIGPMPVDVQGKKLAPSLNTSLAELLRLPGVTQVIGSENKNGVEAIRLKIGPGIPKTFWESFQPLWNDSVWFDVWLAPSYGFAPLQIDFIVENRGIINEDQGITQVRLEKEDGGHGDFLRYRTVNADFRRLKSAASGKSIFFPHKVTFENPRHTVIWTVERMSLPLSIKPSLFVPAIPDGFTVVNNGQLQIASILGGKESHTQQTKEIADAAKAALETEIPQAPQELSSRYLPWIIGAAVIAFSISLILYYRQS